MVEKSIYNYKKRFENAHKRFENSKLSPRNKEIIKKFIENYSIDNNLKQARVYKYISNFRKATELLGKDLDKVDVDDIRKYISTIKSTEMSERTREDYIILIKVFYKWYGKNNKNLSKKLVEVIEYIREFTYKVDKNQIEKKEILQPEEIKKLISYCKNQRDRALIMALWDSGARINEMLTLRNKDVTPFPHGIKITINTSKTDKRTLTLVESAPYIQEYINTLGVRFQDANNSFWIDQYGKPLQYDGVRVQLKRIAQRSGITKNITAHLFRHSRATDLANRGWSDSIMNRQFGWKMGSNMPQTYIRESGIDVEREMLKTQGIAVEEAPESELKPKICAFCSTVNENTNTFCKKCSKPLDPREIQRMENEREEQLAKLQAMQEQINAIYKYAIDEDTINEMVQDGYVHSEEFQKTEQYAKIMHELERRTKRRK